MIWTDYFYYDETSPSFLRWKVDRYGGRGNGHKVVKKDDVAGSFRPNKYYYVKLNNKAYFVHRIIYEIFHGPIPKDKEIDHKDRYKTHNSIWNLRLADDTINRRNLSKQKNNKSGVTGVSLYKNFWCAQWFESGKHRVKWFNIKKYGNNARHLACEFRHKMIEEQNALGAGYTDFHGK